MIQKAQDENYIDLIISDTSAVAYGESDSVISLGGGYSVIHLPIDHFEMCLLGGYPYYSFPSILTLNSQLSLEKSGVTSMQQNPNFNLRGQGVLLSVIDTGIDYQHPAFLNEDNTSRITAIWDQTILDGNSAEGYGEEYSQEQINAALKADNPLAIVPSTDDIGHGTWLTGVACGNEVAEADFAGVAPEADILVVKVKQAKQYNRRIYGISDNVVCYQSTDLTLGMNYAVKMAERLQQPLILCIGMGSSQGGNDGEGHMSGYLDFISQRASLGAVVAAGNEGNSRRHYRGVLPANKGASEFELNIAEVDSSFTMEIWLGIPYRASIQIVSPTGVELENVFPSLSDCRKFDLILEQTVLWINNIIMEERSGSQLIVVRFRAAQSGIWTFRLTNLDDAQGSYNVWLPSGDLISSETYLVDADPDLTLTAPANVHYPLVVTAYNQNDDSMIPKSSRGFTLDNMIKPDLSAPGFALTCPVPGGGYGSVTGTGAAAAHAAGIAAMLMEWGVIKGNYRDITGRDINKLLIRGAQQQSGIEYPNRAWGYGEINILSTFERMR